MLALVCIDTAVVLLLAVLVAGLLRSHADILRALHSLGADIGDPSTDGHGHGRGATSPVFMGPTLPPERDAASPIDVHGVTPEGDAVAIGVGNSGFTLLAFLSTGCLTCAGFWEALRGPGDLGLPAGVRVVAVTKGPAQEAPAEVRKLATGDVPVVMSSEAWDGYEVPGSPFFVLLDGQAGRRIGEGTAMGFEQVARMVRQAIDEAALEQRYAEGGASGGATGRGFPRPGAADRRREAENDAALIAAGILPGDPSLYPASLDDLIAGSGSDAETAGGGTGGGGLGGLPPTR